MSRRVFWWLSVGAGLGGVLAAGSAVLVGTSRAQDLNVWDGNYAGVNIVHSSAGGCSQWAPTDGGAQTLGNPACGSEDFGGGIQVGENFQYGRFFWGVEGSLDAEQPKTTSSSLIYKGSVLPSGTYSFAEKSSPNYFAIVAPRVGYAGGNWIPYVKGGAIIASGARDSMIAYAPSGSTTATVSFNGGRNFSSVGWVAGGGFEWGLYGPWSIGLEYLHVDLGKASSAQAGCAGTASACTAFTGISLVNEHSGFESNSFRIVVNYYFDLY
jgi:opacity protein-like surface antigen